jgi:3'-phosphoadenosine 5'-phosphosulfate sulfotransferase (PAPS reductase)/FAD synthetase
LNLVFKEYCQFLKDKTGLELNEGYYWYDNSIIKAFDKQGNIHKIYRLKVNDDLSMTYSIPKGYDDIRSFDLASWEDTIEVNKDRIEALERESLELIKNKIEKFANFTPLIPISTGKDSMVVTYLVRKILPDTKAVFNNTSLDCADTYKMVKDLPNCEIMNPDKGFYQYVESDHMIPTRFARFCCRIFKVGVMVSKLDHEHPYLMFMGMRNEESATRASYDDEWINESEWGKTEWQGILPIRKWTEFDIWLYTLYRKLNINTKYKKGYSRCGCHIACPYYTRATWALDKYWYPKAYERWRNILKQDFVDNKKWIVMNCTIDEYLMSAWNGGTYRDEPTEAVIEEFAEYNNLKHGIAEKYFNKYCANECKSQSGKVKKIKDKQVLAMNMKLHGRNVNKFYCKSCLMKMHDIDVAQWGKFVNDFKQQGCDLF